MERLKSETHTESLIAPHEVRELVTRLSRSTVESRSVEDVHSLEGLSVNTGIPVSKLREELNDIRGHRRTVLPFLAGVAACLALLGATYVAWPRATPVAPLITGATAPIDLKTVGLVPLTSVTYGPDSGSVLVDPSFEPSHPLPDGISISTQTGNVLWGAGNHRAKALQQALSNSDAERLKRSVEELLEYARAKALDRGLPLAMPGLAGQNVYAGKGFSMNVAILSFYGVCGTAAHLPPKGIADADAKRIIRRAAGQAVDQLQQQLRQTAGFRDREGPR